MLPSACLLSTHLGEIGKVNNEVPIGFEPSASQEHKQILQ